MSRRRPRSRPDSVGVPAWVADVDWRELRRSAHVVSIPMPVKFRGITRREALLFRGPAGWGEFSPFTEYGDDESARWLLAGLEAAWRGWPEPVRETVAVNATVPAVAASDVPRVLARFPGATTAKIKVAEPSGTRADDVARVRAARAELGDDARIRADANAGWSVAEAVAALTALAPFRLEYAEQPVATVEELVELRRRLAGDGIDVPIAADESIRKSTDPIRVAEAGAADIVIVKAQPLGGVRAGLDIAAACGLETVVSSALDTSVGIRAGLALAAALPELDHACGLSTVNLLADDVATRPLVPEAGRFRLDDPAVIPAADSMVDPGKLDRLAAPPDRRDWWFDRLRRCFDKLARGTMPA